MEVTAEEYAWLTSINVINQIEMIETTEEGLMKLPEKIEFRLLGGKYFKEMILDLEKAYNAFYKITSNYTKDLLNLKEINDNDEYIPNSVKFDNWKIILAVINRFGIKYEEKQFEDFLKGDKKIILDLIHNIFNIYDQFTKRAHDLNRIEKTQEEPAKKAKKTTEKKTRIRGQANSYAKDKKMLMGKDEEQEPKVSAKSVELTPIPEATPQKKKGVEKETINIEKLNPNKSYTECESLLEFIIVSLCRNLQINPRQALALISNNRKYLKALIIKGMKGDYSKLINWVYDLTDNERIIVNLLNENTERVKVIFSIIGTIISSKNDDLVSYASKLLQRIKIEVGMDWEWMAAEGINAYIVAFFQHEKYTINLLDNFLDIIKDHPDSIIKELRRKFEDEKDRKKIIEFFNLFLFQKDHIANPTIKESIANLIFQLCTEKKTDLSLSMSFLADIWANNLVANEKQDEIFNRLNDNSMSNSISLNKQCSSISHLFNLIYIFGEARNKYAPAIYKQLVLSFLSDYDYELKREFYLINFQKFFQKFKRVPIDILLEPYLTKLKASNSYSLCDFSFIIKVLEHPRILVKHIIQTVNFAIKVIRENENYRYLANDIITFIISKGYLELHCNEEERQEIYDIFLNFMKFSVGDFMNDIENIEKNSLLETPYDIIVENIPKIKEGFKPNLIQAVLDYRKIKQKNSNALLALLWTYPEHDDILLQMAEMYRPKYMKVDLMLKKREEKKKQEEKTNKARFLEQNKEAIRNYHQKRRELELLRLKQAKDLKVKESNIRKSLERSRILESLKAGVIMPLISNDFLELKNLQTSLGVIEESKEFNIKTSSNALAPLKKIPRSGSAANITKDDVYKRFGGIFSIDRKKQMETYKNSLFDLNRALTSKKQILREGTVIKGSRKDYINSLSFKSNKIRSTYITSEIYKNFILPINLEEEEDRELKAITGYNKKYKRILKNYFRMYSNENTKTMTKNKLLKLFRDQGFNPNQINLEELNITFRNIFGENTNEISFNDFIYLLVQLSYLIYTKRRDTLSIGECYGFLLKKLSPKSKEKSLKLLKAKYKPVIDLLMQKMTSDEDVDFNMPPGFKVVEKTSVMYNSRLAPHFVSYLGESKYICYEIIEEIIFNILNSSILEPYLKVTKYEDIEIEPCETHLWSINLMKNFVTLDCAEEPKLGIEVTDVLNDLLRKTCKGVNKEGKNYTNLKEDRDMEFYKICDEEDRKKEENRQKRDRYIKRKLQRQMMKKRSPNKMNESNS